MSMATALVLKYTNGYPQIRTSTFPLTIMTTTLNGSSRNSSMTVEEVKSMFDWIVVVLAGLTFVSIAVVLVTGNTINKRQAAQLREFDQGLTAAKTQLGEQQERAATAERSLLALQEHLQPRHLSPEQKEAIKRALQGLPPRQVNISAFMGTPDGTSFGLELVAAIKSGGWAAVFSGQESSGGELRGIALIMKDTSHPSAGVAQLQEALKAAGLSAPAWSNPQWGAPES